MQRFFSVIYPSLLDVELEFEHLNFEDCMDQYSLASRPTQTEKTDKTQELTGAPRNTSPMSSVENHNEHKNTTGKETYAQDTDSETDE